jgi:PAS domain S-box-containing protein
MGYTLDTPSIVQELKELEKNGFLHDKNNNLKIKKKFQNSNLNPPEFQLSLHDSMDHSNFYQNLIETSPDGIVVLDIKGNITFANESSLKMLGYCKEEIIGKNFKKLNALDLSELPKYLKIFHDLIKGREIGTIQVQFKTKEGNIIWTEVNVSVIKHQNTNIGLLVISRDITHRKESIEKIKNSEELYKKLIDNSPDAVTIIDPNGNISVISSQTMKLFRYDKTKELLGKNSLCLIDPVDHEKIKDIYQKILEKGHIKNVELTFKRKDGSNFTGELNVSLLTDKEGKIKALISNTRDET